MSTGYASTLDDEEKQQLKYYTTMHVIVIVLGDLGRSPRMQYHCVSLLDAGHYVTVIGYVGERLIPALSSLSSTPEGTIGGAGSNRNTQQRLQVIRFHTPTLFKKSPFYFIWRLLSLTYYLTYALVWSATKHPIDFVLVQNPPAIPLLGIAYVFCHFIKFRQRGRRPGLIIDWHNLGYSMFRDRSMLQTLTKVYERYMAPCADGHLTVTKAMKEYLITDMGITTLNIDVLYDCPPLMFEPLDVSEQHKMLLKLNQQLLQSCPKSWMSESDRSDTTKTLFTEEYMDVNTNSCCIRHRPGRPALVTSSTSWTPDEDFGLLLKAMVTLDNSIKLNVETDPTPPLRVLVIVTGKGPDRSMYEARILQLRFEFVAIVTVWLEAEDYPKLLACADVGISLHTSTSGYDLPMKILDLFGCEVPVIAHDFNCLHELVQDRVNGRIFSTSDELSNLLYTLLQPVQKQQPTSITVSGTTNSTGAPMLLSIPNHSFGDLQTFSEQLKGRTRWHTNWIDHALPVIMLATPKK